MIIDYKRHINATICTPGSPLSYTFLKLFKEIIFYRILKNISFA